MKIKDIDQNQWSIDSLNKSYRQGYLFGLSGEPKESCPFQAEVIAAAWEAGWIDGKQQSHHTVTEAQLEAIA